MKTEIQIIIVLAVLLLLAILAAKWGWLQVFSIRVPSKPVCSPFGDKWQGKKTLAVDTLRYVTQLLDYYQIEYFLAYGTLLGFARNKELIDWDNDLDLVVIADPADVRKRLRGHLEMVTHWRGFDKVFLPDATPVEGQAWKWPFVDLFYAEQRQGKLLVYNRYGDTTASEYSCDQVFPLKRRKFYGFKVWVPRNIKGILQQEYGRKYRKVCQSSNFDHAREESVDQVYQVKCRNLKQHFDGFPTYLINLPERVDRKINSLAQLARLDIQDPEVIKASSPRDAHVQAMYAGLPVNPVSIEEFACGLSHIRVWRQMVERGTPLALIVEDDIAVPDGVTYQDLVARLADSKGGNMVFLGYCGGRSPVIDTSDGQATTFPGTAVCLHAYFLTLEGAKRLVKAAKQWNGTVPIDWITERMCRDKLCYLSTTVSQPRPGYFGHGIVFQNRELGTNIHNKKPFESYLREIPTTRRRKIKVDFDLS